MSSQVRISKHFEAFHSGLNKIVGTVQDGPSSNPESRIQNLQLRLQQFTAPRLSSNQYPQAQADIKDPITRWANTAGNEYAVEVLTGRDRVVISLQSVIPSLRRQGLETNVATE